MDDGTILSISGIGAKPKKMGIFDWNKQYTGVVGDGNWTKIYRVPSSNPNKAVTWAKNNYVGKNSSYGISTNFRSTDPTYCSKIAWHSYYFGDTASKNKARPAGGHIILPYSLPKYFGLEAKLILVWD